MLCQCEVLSIRNVGVRMRLFDTLVCPVLLHGCEMWGLVVMQCGCLRNSLYLGDIWFPQIAPSVKCGRAKLRPRVCVDVISQYIYYCVIHHEESYGVR